MVTQAPETAPEIKHHNLWFDYKSNSRIRFKKENCFENEAYPRIYRITTERLDFTVPRRMTIFSDKHVFIPLAYYRQVLTNYDGAKP
jgi:hypothetical protein